METPHRRIARQIVAHRHPGVRCIDEAQAFSAALSGVMADLG